MSDEHDDTLALPAPRNHPGQPIVAYRVGTHGEFLERMLAAIYRQPGAPGAGDPPLAPLTARSTDDPAIALLDAWATTADVLTFYQERIANEHYLRTATEERSVLELARMVGYQPKPAVAATVDLAFTLDEVPGAPLSAPIPEGTRVQSVPQGGELPQIFETVETIDGRAAWNALRPRQTRPQPLLPGATGASLAGTATNLRSGDALLFLTADQQNQPDRDGWDVRIVTEVTPEPRLGRTNVSWHGGLWSRGTPPPAGEVPVVFALRLRAAIFGHSAPPWRSLPDAARATYLGLADVKDRVIDSGGVLQIDRSSAGGSATSGAYLVSRIREYPFYTMYAPHFPETPSGGIQYYPYRSPKDVADAFRTAAGTGASQAAREAAQAAAAVPGAVANLGLATIGVGGAVLNAVKQTLDVPGAVLGNLGDFGKTLFSTLFSEILGLKGVAEAAETAANTAKSEAEKAWNQVQRWINNPPW